jgi:hypothetical protein
MEMLSRPFPSQMAPLSELLVGTADLESISFSTLISG